MIHGILKEYWGFDQFRPLQEEIIQSVLDGSDTLALMPTGGGKSICYQVPAMAKEGLCLVISPLIALMKDQVEGLRRKNITAFAIYSGMTRKEIIQTLRTASESNCKFLYVSPERLETALFKEYLPGLGVNLVAVDEAHCISQWGYDFRPSYLKIASLREDLPGIPVLALTASATPAVQQDICDKLAPAGSEWKIFRQSFERPNLSYSVFRVDSKIHKIVEILTKVNGAGIVYCRSRKRTKEISELLQLQQISADHYHAGLDHEERMKRQDDWIHNRTRIMVCTNAFGMGIDKPDVRVVIHADTPDCLENYYQEAGRAGRDKKTSYAVLLHDHRELKDLENSSQSRFPATREVRELYQSIANYLQVPAGSGKGIYYDFDLGDFLRKFPHDPATAVTALKILEQDQWLTLTEQVFLPATICFTSDRNILQDFESSKPTLEPLIKTLLRSYEGIFDWMTPISEKMIAIWMKSEVEIVKQQLTELHRAGILEYRPQKDKPQLCFTRNRIRAEDLQVDQKALEKRKSEYLSRVRSMLDYVNEEVACRSRILASYFGDTTVRSCGICDNCLRQKSVAMSREEFDTLHHRIINMVKYESLETAELFNKLGQVKREKAWKVLEFLQSENKITVDRTGKVKLNSH